jgi:hypothetical protein
MFQWPLILFLITFTAPWVTASAQAFRRDVSFEWEELPNAKSYDVQITSFRKDGGKAMTFKTKEPVWNGKLVPGKYGMSLRGRDVRGVPGEWSPVSEFMVNLDPVKVQAPLEKATIAATDDQEISQKFEWLPVNGANEYRFELSSDDGKTTLNELTKETHFTATLPVAQKYTWKVTGIGQNEMQSDSVTVTAFAVQGPKIDPPKITPPETEFVREVKWLKPKNSENVDVTLMKLNPRTRHWEKVLVQENFAGESLAFDEKFEGGTYSLIIKAKAPLRTPSSASKVQFKVVSGDRSPAAEYTALVRTSIDRVVGWYAVASYLITQIDYSGESPETGGRTTTTALGGTGRLGAGYFSPNDRWGFLTILDLSGFIISGANRTYSSIEVSGISRSPVGDRGELRGIAGLYYQELPQLIGSPAVGATSSSDILFVQTAVAGPHVGAEYWHSLTPKFGFQMNSHFYYSMLTMKTPNGNNVEPRISYQLGLMGSYRFSRRFTGLMGLTHRTDQVAYKAVKTGSVIEGTGNYDESRVTGNYLSFFAEYEF